MLIVAQDLIDDPHETVQFRTPDRLRPAIPGRQAVAQHLAHRLSGQSEASRRRTLAQPFHIDAAPYLSIELHSIHPSCVPRNTIGMLGGPLERSGFPPPSGDADRRSVVYFCSAVLSRHSVSPILCGTQPVRLCSTKPMHKNICRRLDCATRSGFACTTSISRSVLCVLLKALASRSASLSVRVLSNSSAPYSQRRSQSFLLSSSSTRDVRSPSEPLCLNCAFRDSIGSTPSASEITLRRRPSSASESPSSRRHSKHSFALSGSPSSRKHFDLQKIASPSCQNILLARHSVERHSLQHPPGTSA